MDLDSKSIPVSDSCASDDDLLKSTYLIAAFKSPLAFLLMFFTYGAAKNSLQTRLQYAL